MELETVAEDVQSQTRPVEGRTDESEIRHALVFAIAHEIANHLGAIRLQAHLLDADLDARALALSSIEIDDLAGRAGSLLALLRPILLSETHSAHRLTWSGLLRGLSHQLEGEGTRGIRVEVSPPGDAQLEAPGLDWIHSLLAVLVGATLAVVPARGTISLRLESRGGETVLIVEDDAAEEDLSAAAALRGRPLAVSIARFLVGRLGGCVDTKRTAGKTLVELSFPKSL